MSSRFSLEPCGRCGKKVNFGLQPQKTVVHKAGLVLIWNIRALGFDWRVFLAFISWAEIAHQQWFKSFWQEWWWPKQARQLCELYSTVYLSLKNLRALVLQLTKGGAQLTVRKELDWQAICPIRTRILYATTTAIRHLARQLRQVSQEIHVKTG